MEEKPLSLILKGIIWACLGVIFFSVLFVSPQLFFPFIVTKTIAFQISVEVMFLAFLLLCVVDERYRLRLNTAVLLILLYLVVLTIASAFSGNDFYHSFWSNNERGDGILTLIHLSLFCVVLSGFFRSVKEWLYVFELFLAAVLAVAIVSFDQYLAIVFADSWQAHFIPSSNGARLAATIGNAGYVAGYMVFGLFTSLFMLFKWKKDTFDHNYWWLAALSTMVIAISSIVLETPTYIALALIVGGVMALSYSLKMISGPRVYYGLLALFTLFIAVQTQTRGAYLALIAGLGIFAVYLLFFYYRSWYLKVIGVAVIILGVSGLVSIFAFKDTAFIKNQPVLKRIASISLSEGTANNRLATWGFALEGIKEKPLLGWGQENFYQVFDKYYTTKNTEQWFDRSHDMILDRAITGGIIGLICYLALLLLPFYFMWRYYFKEYQTKTDDQEHAARRFFAPIMFTILILAYIIQNLFIFEALATYIPLIMVLSFVGQYSRGWNWEILERRNFKIGLVVIMAVAFIPMVYFFNVKPVKANMDFIVALTDTSQPLQNRIDKFENVISRNTLGNQEYRRHYATFFETAEMNYLSNQSARTNEQDQQMANWANLMEQQFKDQVKENPYSVANWLLFTHFYNISYYFSPIRLQYALDLYDKTIPLSPGRPQVYHEFGATRFYLAMYLAGIDKKDEAKQEFVKAVLMFNEGVNKNYERYRAFNELSQFLMSMQQNQYGEVAAQALTGSQEVKASDIVAQLISDYQKYETKNSLEPGDYENKKQTIISIINWFLSADPKNQELKQQLSTLK